MPPPFECAKRRRIVERLLHLDDAEPLEIRARANREAAEAQLRFHAQRKCKRRAQLQVRSRGSRFAARDRHRPPVSWDNSRHMDFDEILEVFGALDRQKVEYVLVGGVAVGLHGFERATSDVDLFVRPTDANVARLRAALDDVFRDKSLEEISATDLAGDYPTIRYGPPDADYSIDILGRLGSEIAFDDLEYETVRLGGVNVRLATPRTLYRMKRDTVRPIDRIDAEVLRDAFGLEDD